MVEAIQVDLHFDDFVTKMFFNSRPPLDPTELIKKVTDGLRLSPEEMKTLGYCKMDTEFVWLQPGEEILTHIKNVVVSMADHLDDHLNFRKLTLNSLNKINYLITVKLVDWKKKRFTIYDVIEVSEKAKTFMIKARNCFESFSNCKLFV